ncbi:MAG TPA: TCR/Tet family MFS transporter [Planctomycetota bacterium]|nr:TCR/Tet family MFS transporter [Planctomycetota bacterium]
MSDAAPAPKRQAAFAFVFMTVVLDVLALGVIIPVLPELVKSFMGGDTAQAARITGVFGTVWALMQFIFSPLLGVISDRFGRRPVILVSCLGLGLDYLFMAIAPTLGWLFVGRVISGITAASFATAGAYIADVTPPEKRAASFGMLGAAFGLGFVLGPALGGFLGGYSLRLPFWVAGALCLLNTLYGVFVLPESLPPERRAGFSWKKANPVGSLFFLRSHPQLLGMAALLFLYHLAHQVLPSVFILYSNFRYGWTPKTNGSVLATVGICSVIVQALLVRRIVPLLGERRALLTGVFFGAAGFFIYGFASSGAVFWLGVPVFSLLGLYGPSSQAITTRLVSPNEQGQLQGANSCVMGITGMIGPVLFTATFAEFLRPDRNWNLPGAPFLLAACLMVLAFFLALAIVRSPKPSH